MKGKAGGAAALAAKGAGGGWLPGF
jgi:hypothetical protein